METPLSSKAALLQALTVPGYGSDLGERIRRRTGGQVRLRLGSVYPALRSLERKGWVRSRTDVSSGALGRPRRYYELTPEGVAAATAQQQALVAFFLPDPHAGVSPEAVRLMRDRLRRCTRVSAFVLELRRRTSGAAR